MGELVLISGPNGSGKSRFAEYFVNARAGAERWYIATMVPVTEDNARRVEKHRAQRAGLGFRSLEAPDCKRLAAAAVGRGSAVLLEDVSNLLANTLFGARGTAEDVFTEILALRDRCALLVAVTIAGLDAKDYEGETAGYITELNRLNARLLEESCAAAELAEGRPRAVKGDWNGFLEGYRGGVFHL